MNATASSNAKEWIFAMQTEMDALNRLKTWTLVPRPSNRTIIKCRWVYAVNRTIAGLIERFRARLVAKGFSQKAGINFHQTFSPDVKYDSIRIILSIAAAKTSIYSNLMSHPLFSTVSLPKRSVLSSPRDFVLKDEKGMLIDYTNAFMA